MNRNSKLKGFSLIETLLVITLLALIVSLITPNIQKSLNGFQKKLDIKKRQLKKEIENYQLFICGKKKCQEQASQ